MMFLLQSPSLLDSGLPSQDLGGALWKMFLSLVALLALLGLSVWLIRRFLTAQYNKRGKESSIQILERKAISPKTSLYKVSCDNQEFLVTESHLEVRLVPLSQKERIDPSQDSL